MSTLQADSENVRWHSICYDNVAVRVSRHDVLVPTQMTRVDIATFARL